MIKDHTKTGQESFLQCMHSLINAGKTTVLFQINIQTQTKQLRYFWCHILQEANSLFYLHENSKSKFGG